MKSRIITVLIITLSMLFVFASCDPKNEETTANEYTTDAESVTVDTVIDTGEETRQETTKDGYTETTAEETTADTVITTDEETSDTCTSGSIDSDTLLPEKPIIYLYPANPTVCSVKLDFNGKLTAVYPGYNNGWNGFTAYPDGTLIFPDGRQYYALYWEGKGKTEFDISTGFCVKGSDTATFLADILLKLGLNAKEANEFIIYWLPRMQNNAYNLISFQTTAYTDNAKLKVTPEPDTMIRVFMAFKALEKPVDIEPQTVETPQRNGFTVVEWGGTEIK